MYFTNKPKTNLLLKKNWKQELFCSEGLQKIIKNLPLSLHKEFTLRVKASS